MGKKKDKQTASQKPSTDSRALAFSFGDPESVMATDITDYLGVFLRPDGDYYEPPVPMKTLAKLMRANAHHGSAIYFKRNQAAKFYKATPLLPLRDFKTLAFERFLFGQAYMQRITNRFGQVLRLHPLPAINMRRMRKPGQYCMLQGNGKPPVVYKPGEVIHIKEYDPTQQIYGAPDYLPCIQSVLLNESATLFRRKYYDNGAHLGYIFYTADAELEPADEKLLKEQISKSKGVGNFRSMFLNIPGGKPDSVKIIPVGDIATKDEFERVKNISRNDILSGHRIYAALAGLMPENDAGFGDIEKIDRVYYGNETVALQDAMKEINEYLPAAKHISFEQPQFMEG